MKQLTKVFAIIAFIVTMIFVLTTMVGLNTAQLLFYSLLLFAASTIMHVLALVIEEDSEDILEIDNPYYTNSNSKEAVDNYEYENYPHYPDRDI